MLLGGCTKLLTVESPTDRALADALAEERLACGFRRRVVLLLPRSCSAVFCEEYSVRTCESFVLIYSRVRWPDSWSWPLASSVEHESPGVVRRQADHHMLAAVGRWFRSKFSFKPLLRSILNPTNAEAAALIDQDSRCGRATQQRFSLSILADVLPNCSRSWHKSTATREGSGGPRTDKVRLIKHGLSLHAHPHVSQF